MKKNIAAACFFLLGSLEAAQEPEAVFKRSCMMCHSGQLAMAPKKGD